MGRSPLGGPLPWLGLLLVVYLAFPIAAFAGRVASGADRGFSATGLWSAVGVSVESATASLLLTTLLGVPLAHVLATHRGRVASVVGMVVQLPLALPPLMSGILLIYVLGPYTTLGRLSGGRLTESVTGLVLAQAFVSAPFLVVAARSAFATVEPGLRDVAATLGHRPLARFLRIDLRWAGPAIRAGMVLAWLRAFGEYGANVIVAYHPFSLPVYTDTQFQAFPLSTTEAPTLLAFAAAAVAVAVGQARLPRRRRSVRPPPPEAPRPVPATAVGFDLHVTAGTFRLDLAHPAGASRLALVGPSGSGKSVTLRALAGLSGPGVGAVGYGGVDVSRVPPERRRVGYLPQGLGLVPGLTVWAQVVFGVHADPARAAWWVATLHLDDLLDRRPDQLSGGQRQRVSLARALAGDPEVVLLDEPFSALDAPVRDELRRELRRIQRETGVSTVIVTHDPEEAALLADEVLVIADGAVLQAGPVTEVYRHPVSQQVARLLGIDNVCRGVLSADGTVRTGSVALAVTPDVVRSVGAGAGRDDGATDVWWRVPAAAVRITPRPAVAPTGSDPTGSYPATVLDVVDVGVTVETTVRLLGGPVLRSRAPDPPPVGVGDACLLRLDPAAVTVWPVPPGFPASPTG